MSMVEYTLDTPPELTKERRRRRRGGLPNSGCKRKTLISCKAEFLI